MEHYLAFISYRHARADQHVSSLLRRYLENFHLPPSCGIPARRRVFRDTDELPTSTDLGADIENALENSEYLIAVCSEEYVQSKWCLREIDLFIEKGRKSRILPVLISGNKDTSVPEQIQDLPIVLDLRNASNHEVRDKIPDLFQFISGTEASRIAAGERRHRILALGGIFAGIAAILLGVILYAVGTAERIRANNQAIIDATENAALEEEQAVADIENYFLKRAGFLARRAWTAIGQGNDREAVSLASSAFSDSVDYLADHMIYLPDSVEAVDALRMALVMPEHQSSTYTSWEDAETDFRIRHYFLRTSKAGLDFAPNREEMVLLGPPSDPSFYVFRPFDEEHYYGEFDTEFNKAYRNAVKAGYRDVIFQKDEIRALYGGGKQLVLRSGAKDTGCFLRGKPFLAQEIWGSPGEMDYVVAWDGYETALFHRGTKEAVAVLPVDGEPGCVAFNQNWQQLALIDSKGALSLFLTEDGSQYAKMEGTWMYVDYGNENYRFCAVTSEGEARKIQALTLETELVFQCPLPVKYMTYCARRNVWLALCDHYTILLDGSSGEYISSTFCWEKGDVCLWEDYDDIEFSHSGDGYYVISENMVSLYRIAQQGGYGSHLLLANESVTGSCHTAFFAPDAESVYLQYDNGDLAHWNIYQDFTFDWVYDGDRWMAPEFYPTYYYSSDGTAFWAAASSGKGIRKVDAEYGYLLYSNVWSEPCDAALIRESGFGSYALSLGKNYDQEMVCFDAEDGTVLWSRESVGNAIFSLTGTEILCLQAQPGSEGDGPSLVFRELDIEDGSIVREQVLCTLDPDEQGIIEMDEETETAVVDNRWFVDLYELTVERQESEPEPEAPLMFAGEEIRFVVSDGRNQMVNAVDGHRILDAGKQKMLLAPDGESVLIYGEDFTPLIVLASGQEELLDEAYWRYDSEEEIDWEEEKQFLEEWKKEWDDEE